MPALSFDFAPWRLSGTVVGVLLNHRPALAALGDAVNAAPYKAAPKAPVLYVKPRNTQVGDGACVAVPAGVPELEVGAALGLVIGRSAYRVSAGDALAHVAGLVIVADLSVPHESFYRPSVRLKARDGFCPIGPRVWPLSAVPALDALAVRVAVDGRSVHETSTGERVRGAAKLLADVSGFMTLAPGDVLLTGVAAGAPRVAAGHAVSVAIEGLGALSFELVTEEPA
ncbi:MAG: 2-hydroxyhepta-2,4-diene-1,7-dioate isomerase [Rubrivivax sp. SCN 71-131]|jgi:5-oxopent-3-ene-1,2,5-tricarboxylate decarboxylase/2-hydroxyhepta-2,4-diene-1,7-dioate isomerase|nr:MAG: 2-hydroxyhepta-2,4-diene-1,7-dioate isomerase [Rubrivivax sp. SCN 71-131]